MNFYILTNMDRRLLLCCDKKNALKMTDFESNLKLRGLAPLNQSPGSPLLNDDRIS